MHKMVIYSRKENHLMNKQTANNLGFLKNTVMIMLVSCEAATYKIRKH